MNNDNNIIPGMTAYLPPTKLGYKEPIKTNIDCNIKDAVIRTINLSFF